MGETKKAQGAASANTDQETTVVKTMKKETAVAADGKQSATRRSSKGFKNMHKRMTEVELQKKRMEHFASDFETSNKFTVEEETEERVADTKTSTMAQVAR